MSRLATTDNDATDNHISFNANGNLQRPLAMLAKRRLQSELDESIEAIAKTVHHRRQQ